MVYRTMFLVLLILCMMLLLGACSVTPAAPARLVCPSIVQYSKPDQMALSAEMKTAGPQTGRFMSDYQSLRDQVRACLKSS